MFRSSCIRCQVKVWCDVQERFEKRSRYQRVVRFEELGSFCNFACRGKRGRILADRCGKAFEHDGVGLEHLQLFEATMEGSLDAGVVAGETVELALEVVVGQEILV
jgi:hypothetical protein